MPTRRTFIAGLTALAATPAHAGSRSVFADKGLAIRGHDPVAYFTDGAPVAGDPALALKWKGAYWLFSSDANRAAFEMDPRRFAPAYGGYCAYAMTQGALATTVPEAWTIFNDRLYLNYSTEVRALRQGDKPGNVVKADAHWPGVLKS
jgi:hypothetical protein